MRTIGQRDGCDLKVCWFAKQEALLCGDGKERGKLDSSGNDDGKAGQGASNRLERVSCWRLRDYFIVLGIAGRWLVLR